MSTTESRFWRALAIVAAVGLACWIAKALSPPNSFSQLLGFGAWAGAAAICAIVLKALSHANDFFKALAAMWRPVVLIVAAGYLLFFNDQGQELGVSLMGQSYLWPLVFLFFALIYWAANTWHTARLGIRAALDDGVLGVLPSQPWPENPARRVLSGDERWLYWLPRLLGVSAHLFAAINLSLAAWRVPLAAWGELGSLRWLAWSAPVTILLATAFVWAEDVKRSSRIRAIASANKIKLAQRVSWISIVGEVALLGGLAILALLPNSVPRAFVPATIVISISCVAFLGAISWLRNLAPPLGPNATLDAREANDRRQRSQLEAFTIGLFLVALLFAFLVWISPTGVGRFFGSMVVAYFAFGAILALVNFFELAVNWIAASGVLGADARPRVVGAYALAFVIALGIVNAQLHAFHQVRTCDGGACAAAPPPASGLSVATLPDDRPTVAQAAKAWYAQAKSAYDMAQGQGPVPMVVVATAGGGIRAAYWTATVLEQLESDLADQGGARPYLFAISGVSGGSVGAAAFDAALTKRDESGCGAVKLPEAWTAPGDAACPIATTFLKEDFLAPALASLVFMDTPSSFLPDFGQSDRGAAIEQSFEDASGGLLRRPFLSFFHYVKGADESEFAASGAKKKWRPILLLNATHEDTGNRLIAGHVLIERNVFIDSLDALHELKNDVRLSTAAHNSARFTYVSPAGNLGDEKGSVIDGGYFENFGALSALEIFRAAKLVLKDKVKPVILMISSDPDLEGSHTLVRINEVRSGGKCLVSVAERERQSSAAADEKEKHMPNYFSVNPEKNANNLVNEFVAPIQGLENVRAAHGNRAAAELAVEICAEFPNAPKPEARPGDAGLSLQMQTATTLDDSKDVAVSEVKAIKAEPDNPYFAHLAMCKAGKTGQLEPIQPPLGWVLSKATQDHFPDLLKTCGNEPELKNFETALGKQQAGGQ
jgi:hypothetical protein